MLARGVLSISILEGDYFAFVYFQKKGLVENPWDLSSAMVVATRSQVELYSEHLESKNDIAGEENLIELHKILGFMDLYVPHRDWLGTLLNDQGWSRIDYLIDSELLQTFNHEFRDIQNEEIEDAIDQDPDCNLSVYSDELEHLTSSQEPDEEDSDSSGSSLKPITDSRECQRTLPVLNLQSQQTEFVKISHCLPVVDFLSCFKDSSLSQSEIYKKYEVSEDQSFEKVYEQRYS